MGRDDKALGKRRHGSWRWLNLTGVGLLLMVMAPALLADEASYFDGDFTFGAQAWSNAGSFLTQTPPALDDRESSLVTTSLPSGGNPDSHVRIESRMPGLDASAGITGTSATGTWGFIFNEAAVYDPETQGPIERINFSWDSRYTPTATPIAGEGTFEDLAFVASSLAVRQYDEAQDRELYWMVFARREFVRRNLHPDWTGFSIMDITAGDFLRFPAGVPGQAAQPDFAKPLTFGYVQGTSCGGQCSAEGRTYFGRAEIDNWQVVVNPGEGIRFSRAEYEVQDDGGEIALAIWRIGDVSEPASVLLSTEDGTAVAGLDGQGDYDAISDRLVEFEAGQSVVAVPVTINGNRNNFQPTLNFIARLHNAVDGVIGTPAEAVVTISYERLFGANCDIGFDSEASSGADLCASSLTTGDVPAIVNVGFSGLTAGFNELPYRKEVAVSLRNMGAEPVTQFDVELRVPKLHLAGFGLTFNGVDVDRVGDPFIVRCEIPLGINDPDFVIVRCRYTYKSGQSLGVDQIEPVFGAGGPEFYFGYAATVPALMEFTLEAEIIDSAPSDPNPANNVTSLIVAPNQSPVNRGGGGGGALSPWAVLVLTMWGAWIVAMRVRRMA